MSCTGVLAHGLVSNRNPEVTSGHPYVVFPRLGTGLSDCARLQTCDRPVGPLFGFRAGRETAGRPRGSALSRQFDVHTFIVVCAGRNMRCWGCETIPEPIFRLISRS